jgi:DNA processing protein
LSRPLDRRSGPEELRWWLALNRAPLIGSRRFNALLERFESPESAMAAGRKAWLDAGLPDPSIRYLEAPDWRAVDQDIAWLDQKNRFCLTCRDAAYPPLLNQIADPPPILFVEGDPQSLSHRHLALVGSRNPTAQGMRIAQEFAAALAGAHFGIVSGLALGIDAAGHEGALASGGTTIAVAGSGLDRIYPIQHRALAQRIVCSGGALVSEFPPGTSPKAGHFPRRNRVISGLALGTLVVEAAAKSGSLITARFALEQNREVFAVPGSIQNPLARGCNDLIKQGAKLVQTVQDVLDEFAVSPAADRLVMTNRTDSALDHTCSGLLKYIAYDPTSVDTLVSTTGIPAESIASQLLMLELDGYIAAAPGGGVVRLK